MNTVKTTLLMSLLTLLFILVGKAMGGQSGMVFAFFLAVGTNFFSYWFSDKLVLRLCGAQEVTRDEAPEIFRIVEDLTQRAGLPMLRVYVIPEGSPNAFATGRNPHHAAVAVTEGILDILSADELKGVLGHELAHVQNRDILIGTIAATMAGAVSLVTQMAQWAWMFGGRSRDDREGGGNPLGVLAAMILAPIAAMLIQLAVSRSREYQADAGGAKISGDPLSLASALRKLEAVSSRRPMEAPRPATAHLFIVNPLRGRGLTSLFSTHPPMEERIKRLEAMADGAR